MMIEPFLTGTGAVAIIGALSAWLSKVWANRILQRDRVRYEQQMQIVLHDLRTRGEKELFVHQLQFEKEFKVYLGLWKGLLQATRAASTFRELCFGSGQTPDQNAEKLRQAINAFKHRVYDYRPFYAPDIYDLTSDLLKKLETLYRDVCDAQRAAARQGAIEECLDETNKTIAAVCDAIRKRIFPESDSTLCSRPVDQGRAGKEGGRENPADY